MNSNVPGENESQPSSSGSNVTSLSLFIIILAFFIFTVAISTPEDTKKTSLLASVEKTFGGLSMAERKTEKLNGKTENKIRPVDFSPILTGDSELSQYADIRVEYEYSAMVVPAEVFFDENSLSIKSSAEKDLGRISDLIKKGGYSAEITGYPSSKNSSEARLSALRAEAVSRFLSEKGGVSVKRLAAYAWTGPRSPENAKTDIEGISPQYIEIDFRSGSAVEEDDSLKFKDFIFKVLD